MSDIPTWTKEAFPGTIAVVNPHPDSDSGYMIIREKDMLPEHELFGPEGKGYPPDHVPPQAQEKADDTEVTVERMTEDELLKGLEPLMPPEPPRETRIGKRHQTSKQG